MNTGLKFALGVCSLSLLFSCAQKLPYQDTSLTAEQRAEDLLPRLTLEEKVALMQNASPAIPRLGIKEYDWWNEALHGVGRAGLATVFPQAIGMGASFNDSLLYEVFDAVSDEARVKSRIFSENGVLKRYQGLTFWTPNVNIFRDPRWGRGQETYGEDPYLVSRMGVSQVRGYLDNQVSPMIKHFGAHGAPQGGLNLASVSCGQRELLSIYLKTFETVVKEAKPWAVMSSYNSWNNEPNSSSHYLMTELLRDRWDFQGYVYSDWGAIGMLNYFHKTAQNSAEAAIQALTAGLDAEASDNSYAELQQLVENGMLDVKYIDQAVARILTAKFNMGLFEYPLPMEKNYDKVVHAPAHVSLARKIAEESIVLLQNENNILPLQMNKLKSIAVIGPNADQVQFGDYT